MREVWGEWLASHAWDWFLTITFREPVPMHRQEAVLNAAGESMRAWHNPSLLFLAAEPHRSFALHLHGLYQSSRLDFVKPFQQRDLWAKLHDTFGRSSVEIPKGKEAVSEYVAKYCVKDHGYYQMWSGDDPEVGKCWVQAGGGRWVVHGGTVVRDGGAFCATCGDRMSVNRSQAGMVLTEPLWYGDDGPSRGN